MSDSTVNGPSAGPGPAGNALDDLLARLECQPRDRWLVLLRADQHERWGLGQRLPAEVYLEQLSSLSIDDETAVDLIYSEVLLRIDRDEKPTAAEYSYRFPRYAASLRQQFNLLAALRGCPDLRPADATQEAGREGRHNADTLQIADRGLDNSTLVHPTLHCDESPASPPGYEIIEELGRGGMGVVYLAWQKGLDRFVALKMMREGDRVDSKARERIRKEAATAARLSHPNIVQVYEVGEHHGRPFFSLEFCDGGSLSEALARRPQPPRAAAEMVETLARAVEHAHCQGIVHRDLKPANVLLVSGGMVGGGWSPDSTRRSPLSTHHLPLTTLQLKIADFGLARQMEAVGHSHTQAIIGTPGYMAPEQAAGRQATPATDVHALGTILYELLTGRPPFGGENVLHTLEQVRYRNPVPPASLNGQVHRDINTICLKCLQKDPHARYPSALALAEDLRRFLNNEPIQARPVGGLERGSRWCRRNPAWALLWALSALALLGLLLGVAVHQVRLAEEEERTASARRKAQVEKDARQAAQRAEAVQRYFSALARVREKQLTHTPGWTWEGLEELQQACDIKTDVRDVVQLRTEAAALLAGIDLREQTTLAQNFCAAASAVHPDGDLLALGELKAQGFLVSTVRVIDL